MKKFILLVIAAALIAAVIFLAGGQQEDAEQELVYYSNRDNLSTYTLENEYLTLEMSGSNAQFVLTDKRTGRVWNSVPDGASSDPMAMSSIKNTMLSPLVVNYSDSAGSTFTYDAYTYAIKDGTFSITQEDGKITVDYMIGPSVRFYIVPEAISEERMKALQENMDKSLKSVVTRNYRKLDINKQKDEEVKAELLEMIPQLADTVMYALPIATGGDALPKHVMEQLEEAFLSAGYTEEQALEDAMGNVDYSNVVQFNLSMVYSLDGDSLVVEVPEDRISYPQNNPITELRVLPYFCSASDGDEGYMLVPDGGGGQIFFHNGKTNHNNFYTNVYGFDEAFNRQTRIQDPGAAFPVFGIARNGAHLLAVAEGGAAEMAVEADIAGKWSSYDYVCPVFTIVHGEDTEVSQKSNSSVVVYQETELTEIITVRYFAGNSDSYVDMAQRYREYLISQYPSFTLNDEQGLPLVMELIGAIDKTEKVLGIPVRQTYAATEYDEAQSIIEALQGIENVRVLYSAIFNGGMDQSALTNIDTVGVLGTEAQREALVNAAKEAGVKLYLGAYAQMVMNQNWFNSNSNAIRDTSNVAIKKYPYDQNTQTETEKKDDLIYLLNMAAIEKTVNKLHGETSNWGNAGMSFADLGDILYSDFSTKNGVSRDEMRRQQRQLLQQLHAQGADLMISGGNEYAAISAECIINMELQGGGYDIVDRSIPFYQIVLHGYVPYTGAALNAEGDYYSALLKAVETGAGLNFVFFETDYQQIVGSRYTFQTNLYSANFSDWQDTIASVYTRMNDELGHTVGLTIMEHTYISEFVTKTVYSDGTAVYVNHGAQDYQIGTMTVPAQDWVVEKGE